MPPGPWKILSTSATDAVITDKNTSDINIPHVHLTLATNDAHSPLTRWWVQRVYETPQTPFKSSRRVTHCQARHCPCSSTACPCSLQRRSWRPLRPSPQGSLLPPGLPSELPAGSHRGCQAAAWVWWMMGWRCPRCRAFPLRGRVGAPCSGSWGWGWPRRAGCAGCRSGSWSCGPLSLCASVRRSWCWTSGSCRPWSPAASAGDTGTWGYGWTPAWTRGCSRGRWWGSGSCWSSPARRWLWRGSQEGAGAH